MRSQSLTFSDEDRLRFGGDCAITNTVPTFHPDPKIAIPLTGTRNSIEGGEVQDSTFFRGDLINIENKEGKFNFALWTDDGSRESQKWFMTLKRKGFLACKASEWELHPDLDEIYTEQDGLIVRRGGMNFLAGGMKPVYDVVMWRTEKRMLEEQAKLQMAPRSANDASGMAQQKIGGVLTDSRISVLPTEVAEIPHRRVVE